MNDAQMTLVGNLVEDPELRFTPAGQPLAKFRVASTPRYRDNATGEWKDGDSLFLTCTVWRQRPRDQIAVSGCAPDYLRDELVKAGLAGGYLTRRRNAGGRLDRGRGSWRRFRVAHRPDRSAIRRHSGPGRETNPSRI